MSELELKLKLDDAAVEHWRAMLTKAGAARTRLRATYFDTSDGKLDKAHIALRVRQEGRRWVQTLKVAGDSAVHRLEHEVNLSPAAARRAAAPQTELHRESAGFELLQDALGNLDAPLAAQYGTDIWRLHCLQTSAAGTSIEVALDLGSVTGSGRTGDLAELEFEHRAGPVEGLFDTAIEAVRAGGVALSTISKAAQGMQLKTGAPLCAVKARRVRLPARADGATLLREALRGSLEHCLANASLIAHGGDDGEVVHQLRVGLRRLRTALRELAWLSPRIDAGWEDVLGHAFAKLGERRDNEEVLAAVGPLLDAAAAPRTTWDAPTFEDVRTTVRSPDFQVALLQILALAHADDAGFSAVSHSEVKKLVGTRLHKLHRQVLRDGRHFDRLATERQHQVRKRLKRLRYLAEFVETLWSTKAVDRFIDRLKPAQEALGHHNDCIVAAERFRRDAETQPLSWFAVGFLQSHQSVTQRHAHKALRALADTEPFWE